MKIIKLIREARAEKHVEKYLRDEIMLEALCMYRDSIIVTKDINDKAFAEYKRVMDMIHELTYTF